MSAGVRVFMARHHFRENSILHRQVFLNFQGFGEDRFRIVIGLVGAGVGGFRLNVLADDNDGQQHQLQEIGRHPGDNDGQVTGADRRREGNEGDNREHITGDHRPDQGRDRQPQMGVEPLEWGGCFHLIRNFNGALRPPPRNMGVGDVIVQFGHTSAFRRVPGTPWIVRVGVGDDEKNVLGGVLGHGPFTGEKEPGPDQRARQVIGRYLHLGAGAGTPPAGGDMDGQTQQPGECE
jgi:hypothetical protein